MEKPKKTPEELLKEYKESKKEYEKYSRMEDDTRFAYEKLYGEVYEKDEGHTEPRDKNDFSFLLFDDDLNDLKEKLDEYEWQRRSYEQEMDETARKYKELTGKDLSDFF